MSHMEKIDALEANFLLSVRRNDLKKVEEYIKEPEEFFSLGSVVNVNHAHNGMTALHFASKAGNLPMTELLLKYGGDLSLKNKAGETPLSLAAKGNHGSVVECLAKAGADLMPFNNKGNTPLHEVADPEMVTQLIALGSDPNVLNPKTLETPLHRAVQSGHSERVESLIQAGALLELQNANGFTPLFLAVQYEDGAIRDQLIQAGANPGAQDYNGNTPLHFAAGTPHSPHIQPLIDAGADPSARNRTGSTPLLQASISGDEQSIETLILAGASVLEVDDINNTMLHYAVFNSNEKAVNAGIEWGANINAQNEYDETPLHMAYKKTTVHPIIKSLLQAGADPKIVNEEGLDPVSMMEANRRNQRIDHTPSLNEEEIGHYIQAVSILYGSKSEEPQPKKTHGLSR